MDVTPTLTRFATYAELPAEIADDAMLWLETDPAVLHGAWATEGGFAYSSVDGYGGAPCWLYVVASPETVPVLLDAALADLGDACDGFTVPRGVDVSKWAAAEDEPGLWDLMRTDAAPPAQPGEERVARVGDRDAVQAFLDRVNPSHSVRSDHREVEFWLGVADEASGELLSVGAFTRRPTGVGYLASIATAPEARGQGLGAAVSAALARHAFAVGDPMCLLAHYHPNDSARRLYQRLGYRTTHQNSSIQRPRANARARHAGESH